MKKALVITGGDVSTHLLNAIYEENQSNLFVLGVDGGCEAGILAGIPLDLAIGDFDTLDLQILKDIKSKGIPVMELNPIKDMTDSHAALDYLSKEGCIEVIVVGGFGTRLDHTLGNLMMGFNFVDKMKIVFLDNFNKVELFEGPSFIKGIKEANYKYLSILPIEKTKVAYSKGLRYDVKDQIFLPFDSFGISNEIKDEFEIKVEHGRFLLMQSRD